jgi:hypothetical protein
MQAQPCTRKQHFRNGRTSRRQIKVAAGIVGHFRVVMQQDPDVVRFTVHTVGCENVWTKKSNLTQEFRVRLS